MRRFFFDTNNGEPDFYVGKCDKECATDEIFEQENGREAVAGGKNELRKGKLLGSFACTSTKKEEMKTEKNQLNENSQPEPPSNMFSLAMTVGLFTMFATNAEPGGLSGGQGFWLGLVGTTAAYFIIGILLILVENKGSKPIIVKNASRKMVTPDNITITKSEENGTISIHLHFSDISKAIS